MTNYATGAAFVAPFLTVLITTGICTWIGKKLRGRQLLWAAATQRRVTAVSYVVGCMKGVRMLGLSDTVFRMLTKLRELEVAANQHIRRLLVWVLLLSNVMFQLTTLATYVTFAVIMLVKTNSTGLDFHKLYGSLSALKLVTSPMMIVLQLIPTLQTSLASLYRIEQFLKSGAFEPEQLEHSAPASVSEGVELAPLSAGVKNAGSPAPMLSFRNATFTIDEQPLLFDIKTSFRPGSFTMIIGKVGSGKSIFLRAAVGEMKLWSGSFQPCTSGTSFCDQTVWLRNATVRQNIIGEDEFDEAWYNKVLWSCGLMQDLAEMKKGDQTPIGSKGISLSGGQKNRLSLARALYARNPLLAIDDMLSGLDNTTEKLVFDRVFGRNGTFVRGTHPSASQISPAESTS